MSFRGEATLNGAVAVTWPESPPSTGTLYIALPAGPSTATLRDYLTRSGVPFIEPYPAMIAVPLAARRLQQISQDLSALLSPTELQDSRTLLVGSGVVPTICELRHTESLSSLIGRVQGEWLVDLLREDRLVTHYQPIMPCRAPDSVFAYESLLRGVDHDGTLIPPNVIFGVAKSAALMSHLDRAARFAAIRGAVKHKLESKLFINFIPTTIYDPAFSLNTTVVEIQRSQLEPRRIVFEVVESEQVPDVDRLLHILDFYRDAGFLVALDDLGAGYSSLSLLTRLKPDYVKLDVDLVREVDRDDYKANIAGKLLELARSLGIQTIAEGVETRAEWQWLSEHDCDYVQGFFFGRPASPPELLLQLPSACELTSDGEASGQLVELAVERPVTAPLSPELAVRDAEIRRLREKVGELVMELDAIRRSLALVGGE